jgi:hypothetical protein
MSTIHAPLASLVALAGLAATAQATVFFDGVFAPANWSLTTVVNASAPTSTVSGFQVPAGGNPNEYRRVRHTLITQSGVGQVVGLHLNLTASYTPSSQGAITSINYSEDSIAFSGPGNVQGGGLFIRQNSRWYIQRSPIFVMPLPTFAGWTAQVASGRIASDFHEIDVAGNIFPGNNPDFSIAGTQIDYGFWRGNSNFGSVDTDAGIDNRRVEIVPAPSASGLALMAGVAGVRLRRR